MKQELSITITIENLDELNDLISSARRQANALKKTLEEIGTFEPKASSQRQNVSNGFADDVITTIKATLKNANQTEGL